MASPDALEHVPPRRRPLDAVLSVRRAVRSFLSEPEHAAHLRAGELYVGVSGGADSLALAEAAAHVGGRLGVRVCALVVDHRLQAGSSEIAQRAADEALRLGVHTAKVLAVTVEGPGGPEAAARRVRYAALRDNAEEGALVLLGHTLDDQAETVLLGLGRGSGPRSLAGMRPFEMPWARPLLDTPRAVTRAACHELGVRPWDDPHNTDPRFRRVRVREEVLPLLEDVLAGGVAAALARTARQLREDCDALDSIADEVLAGALDGAGLRVEVLATVPSPVRRRVLRTWLLRGGVRELTDAHLRSADELVERWRGQGGVFLPGGVEARRAHGKLVLNRCQPTTPGS
ncbi:tRNA lysidine(34) synthetase TilS [Saccharomonospora xinjiangensis]|uniref:tRNA lysidine(34) synthetase TilS n=1 Tax=Saccharomonospora xinjiangensis TaxID=75294 RepID=UPI00106F556E|nr:tRNA lysidine(34) synthetase TilS [Saccharomonospora xinjiangensis]QBQ62300.1 tRNA(Ile)-lysidine synthase [Saccharomonospora xinjiangensis]